MSIFSKYQDIDARKMLGLGMMGATALTGISYGVGKTFIEGKKSGAEGEKQLAQNMNQGMSIGGLLSVGALYAHNPSRSVMEHGFKTIAREGRMYAQRATKGNASAFNAVNSNTSKAAQEAVLTDAGATGVQKKAANALLKSGASFTDKINESMASLETKGLANFAKGVGWGTLTGISAGGLAASFAFDEDSGPYSKAFGTLGLVLGGMVAGGAAGGAIGKMTKAHPAKLFGKNKNGMAISNYTKAKQRIIHAADHFKDLEGFPQPFPLAAKKL